MSHTQKRFEPIEKVRFIGFQPFSLLKNGFNFHFSMSWLINASNYIADAIKLIIEILYQNLPCLILLPVKYIICIARISLVITCPCNLYIMLNLLFKRFRMKSGMIGIVE